jgi:hypothetical protein
MACHAARRFAERTYSGTFSGDLMPQTRAWTSFDPLTFCRDRIRRQIRNVKDALFIGLFFMVAVAIPAEVTSRSKSKA